ncbi:hypothetical protein PFISCL1PPCAC_10080, partial [Pristionchus fissidentatus]
TFLSREIAYNENECLRLYEDFINILPTFTWNGGEYTVFPGYIDERKNGRSTRFETISATNVFPNFSEMTNIFVIRNRAFVCCDKELWSLNLRTKSWEFVNWDRTEHINIHLLWTPTARRIGLRPVKMRVIDESDGIFEITEIAESPRNYTIVRR